MKTMLLLMLSYAVFTQLAMLLNAGVCLLLYFILRLFHITKQELLSWIDKYPKRSLCFITIFAEGLSLAILLPICRLWFLYQKWEHINMLLIAFALLEGLPAFYKFHKLKTFMK